MEAESTAPGLLRRYQRVGRWLYRLRYLLVGLLAVCLLLSLKLLFASPGASERFLLPSLVLSTWFILSLSFAHYFARLDLGLDPRAGRMERLFHFFRKAFSYLFAALFTVASLLLLYFSATAIRVAI